MIRDWYFLQAASGGAWQSRQSPRASSRAVFILNAVRRSKGYGSERLEMVTVQHAQMIDALRANDGKAAAAIAFEHAEMSRKDLLAMLPAP